MRDRRMIIKGSMLALAALTFCLAPTAQSQTWVHPGIVVSADQLQATRAAYQAGNPVIVQQVNNAMNSDYGSLNYTVQGPWPGGINQCGADSDPNQGCSDADDDSDAAYVQALLWYITGNQTYANNAINIMNTYSNNFKGYAGTNGLSCPSGTDCSNGPLQSGWDSEKWPRAAEIIYYGTTSNGSGSGWSSAGFTAFQNLMVNIYQPVIENGSGTNGNWDMSMIEGTMEIAVLTQNAALMTQARTMWEGRVPDLFYLESLDGSNHAASPRGSPSWYGQTIFNTTTNNVNQETCRDLTHTEDSISAAIMTAETDWIQGGNLYLDTNTSSETGALVDFQSRIDGALNLISGFESQDPGQNNIIAAPTDFCTSSGATNENEITLGAGATYSIAYNAYHNRMNDPNIANGSGTSGQHGTANTYNWIQNYALNLSETTDYGNHMTLFEALTHTADLCQTISATWTNNAFTAQTGTFIATFSATPSGSPINSVMGLSNGAQSEYTGISAIVRFNPSGDIDAYNGTEYAAASTIPYTAGESYSFEFDVNVAAQTYTVWVTPRGGTKTLVGFNFAFRTPASSLNYFTTYAETGTNNVCEFVQSLPTSSCHTGNTTWNNINEASEATTFTAVFSSTPSGSPINSVMALTDGAQSAYTSLPAIVRFNPSGDIDAYNGTGYSAANTIPYTGGTPYMFEFVVNVPAQTYTVYATPQQGSTVLVGQNYAFRTSASLLNNLSLYAATGTIDECSYEATNY
jgi:hypothetical protein